MEDEYLTREQERELVRRGQAGDVEARNTVIQSVDKMIWLWANRYAKRNRDLATNLHAEAYATLCDKFYKFDLSFECKFLTWAKWWIRNAMQRYLADEHHKGIRLPVHYNDPCLKTKLMPWANQARRVASLDADVSPSTSVKKREFKLSELLTDHREKPADDAATREGQIAFVRQVLDKLQPRDRQILMLRTEYTLEEIAKQMGRTRERIRQLETRAQEKFIYWAEQLNPSLVAEIEHDVRQSNVHWAAKFLRRKKMSAETTSTVADQVAEPKRGEVTASKVSLVMEYIKANPDANYRKIKQHFFETKNLTIYDAIIADARRKLNISQSNSPMAKTSRPAQNGKAAPLGANPAIPLNDLIRVKALAREIGGVDRLNQICAALIQLS